MQNKKIYLISGIILAVSVVILSLFLFLPKDRHDVITPLNCSVENLELEIGQTMTDFYQISDDNAVVSFSVDKPGIVEIDSEKVVALSQGCVNVEMIVALGSQKITKNFVITVILNEYCIKFDLISGGEIQNEILHLSSSICQFYVAFYDKNDTKLNCDIVATVDNNASIQVRFGVFILNADEACTITFVVAEYNFTKTLNVVLN